MPNLKLEQALAAGRRIGGVTVSVTVSSGLTGIYTAQNGLTERSRHCKLLISRGSPLVRCSHNAGVDGSIPSLSTIKSNRYATPHVGRFRLKCRVSASAEQANRVRLESLDFAGTRPRQKGDDFLALMPPKGQTDIARRQARSERGRGASSPRRPTAEPPALSGALRR